MSHSIATRSPEAYATMKWFELSPADEKVVESYLQGRCKKGCAKFFHVICELIKKILTLGCYSPERKVNRILDRHVKKIVSEDCKYAVDKIYAARQKSIDAEAKTDATFTAQKQATLNHDRKTRDVEEKVVKHFCSIARDALEDGIHGKNSIHDMSLKKAIEGYLKAYKAEVVPLTEEQKIEKEKKHQTRVLNSAVLDKNGRLKSHKEIEETQAVFLTKFSQWLATWHNSDFTHYQRVAFAYAKMLEEGEFKDVLIDERAELIAKLKAVQTVEDIKALGNRLIDFTETRFNFYSEVAHRIEAKKAELNNLLAPEFTFDELRINKENFLGTIRQEIELLISSTNNLTDPERFREGCILGRVYAELMDDGNNADEMEIIEFLKNSLRSDNKLILKFLEDELKTPGSFLIAGRFDRRIESKAFEEDVEARVQVRANCVDGCKNRSLMKMYEIQSEYLKDFESEFSDLTDACPPKEQPREAQVIAQSYAKMILNCTLTKAKAPGELTDLHKQLARDLQDVKTVQELMNLKDAIKLIILERFQLYIEPKKAASTMEMLALREEFCKLIYINDLEQLENNKQQHVEAIRLKILHGWTGDINTEQEAVKDRGTLYADMIEQGYYRGKVITYAQAELIRQLRAVRTPSSLIELCPDILACVEAVFNYQMERLRSAPAQAAS